MDISGYTLNKKNMKIVICGDIHGRSIWKLIVEKEYESDRIIFIGDYFDSKDGIDSIDQVKNFNEIINFKKEFPNKVVLLFGNHDFHYLPGIDETYTGHQIFAAHEIGQLLSDCISERLLQMIYCHDKFLFSHAGITKTWCENNIWINENIFPEHLCEAINDLFYFKPNKFKFTVGKNCSVYGDDITQSPIWVRPKSLLEDGLANYIQVVGHTMKDNVEIYLPTENNKTFKGMALIDSLHSGQYLVIENGKMEIEKI